MIENAVGGTLREEQWFYNGTGYDCLAWSVNVLDYFNRVIATYRSDGRHSETQWGCCGKEYERDENGVKQIYYYDAMNRVEQVAKEGDTATGQPDVFTSFTYDAEDRQLSQTVSAGGLSKTSSNIYDLAGHLVRSIDPAGVVTEYSYDGLDSTIVRGGLTNTTVLALDGSVRYTVENGIIKSHSEHGVNQDGTRWTTVSAGPANDPQSALTTTIDMLGHVIREERPGFGAQFVPGYDFWGEWIGPMLANEYSYNTKGQLVRSVVNSPDSTVSNIYEYDELGNQIRSGLDLNANGVLDLAGPDRVNDSSASYQSDTSNNWWRVQTSVIYASDNSSVPTTSGVQKVRLTGLGSTSDLGLLTSDTVSIDLLGNPTVSRTYVDRDNKTVTKTVSYPDSSCMATVVNVNGLVQTSKGKTGHTTSYAYDGLGRQTMVTDPRTGASSTHFDGHGWVDYTTDAAGHTNRFGYDSATGRRVWTQDPLGNTIYTAYDLQGHTLTNWGATYPVAYVYDTYGRMVQMGTWRNPPGGADLTTWQYDDASGLLTNKVYADGKGTAYTYTQDGKLAMRTWARTSGGQPLTTAYAYDLSGNLTNIHYCTAANTPDVSFTYDRLGRQTSASDGIGVRSFAYDLYLQLTNETMVVAGDVPETNVITRLWDTFGRSSGLALSEPSNPSYSTAYTYDNKGRFGGLVWSNATTRLLGATYSYDPEADIVAQLDRDTGGQNLQTVLGYESQRNLITNVLNQAGTTMISQYAYANDAAGRRTSVKNSGAAFDPVGPAFTLYGYNSRGELTSANRQFGDDLAQTPDDVPGQQYAYAYDSIGNRTTADEGAVPREATYTANALNQYTQRTVPGKADVLGAAATDVTVTVNLQQTERHGAYWRREVEVDNDDASVYTQLVVTAVYNPPGTNDPDVVESSTGRLFVAQTPEIFGYDADGNLTNDARWAFSWDGENRLVGMETHTALTNLGVPRVKLAFAYDYMGRRMRTISYAWSNDAWQAVTTNSFVYDGWNLVREMIADYGSPITNSYVWGLDLSGTLQGAGGIGGLLSATFGGTTSVSSVFYAYDANGNVGQLVDTNAAVRAHYEYGPFGNSLVMRGDLAEANPFRFSTKYTDQETGLIYYGYRFYSANLARFPNRDPIVEVGFDVVNESELLNRLLSPGLGTRLLEDLVQACQSRPYLFVDNNPLTKLDYWGLTTTTNSTPPITEEHCTPNDDYVWNRPVDGLCWGSGPLHQTCTCTRYYHCTKVYILWPFYGWGWQRTTKPATKSCPPCCLMYGEACDN